MDMDPELTEAEVEALEKVNVQVQNLIESMRIQAAYKAEQFDMMMNMMEGMIQDIRALKQHPDDAVECLTPSSEPSRGRSITATPDSVTKNITSFVEDCQNDAEEKSSSEHHEIVSSSTEPKLISEDEMKNASIVDGDVVEEEINFSHLINDSNDDKESEIVAGTDTEVISRNVSVEYSSGSVLDHVEISEENFETKFCDFKYILSSCLLPVCVYDSVKVSCAFVRNMSFVRIQFSTQSHYTSALRVKPPPKPPDGSFEVRRMLNLTKIIESAIGYHMIRCRGDLRLPLKLPSMEFKVLPLARVKFKRVYGTFGIWNEVLLFCYSRMGRTDVLLDYLKVKRLFKWLVLVKVFKIIFPVTFTLLMKEMPRGALTCFAKYVLLQNKRLTLSCKAFIVAGVGITKMKRSNKLLRDELGNEVKSTGFGESTELSDAIEDSKELMCSFVSHENHLLLDSRVDYSALSCVSFVAASLSLSGPIYMAIESEELISPEDRCIQIHSVDIRGPALGLRLVSDTLIPDNLSLKIRFVKATDAAEIDNQLAQLGPELTSTLVIFILKGGGTGETRNCLLEVNTTFWEAGLNFARQYVVMAQESPLQDEAAKLEGWVARLPTFYWVGVFATQVTIWDIVVGFGPPAMNLLYYLSFWFSSPRPPEVANLEDKVL